MRILLCSEHYAPVGGAEVYLFETAARLEDKGHEVGVLHDAEAAGDLAGARPTFRVPGALGFLHSKKREVVRAAKKAAASFAPDVIYLLQALNPPVTDALAQAAPAVRYALGLRLTCPSGRRLPRTWDGVCTKPFDALCLWKAHTQLCMPRRPDTALRVWSDVRRNQKAANRLHRLLVPSRYVRDMAVASGIGPDRVEVLHPYTGLAGHDGPAGPAAERRILAIGRPAPEKGFQEILKALPLIETPATLEIAGDGPYLDELRHLASRVPPRHQVVFSGQLPRERVPEAYRRARVAVLPSIWPEPFGIVGIEAMAHGLPAVAFDVGGVSDWLSDGETGALVPRKDTPALARALEGYLSDPNLAAAHGAKGRETVTRRFRPEYHIGRLLEIFGEAAEGKTG